MRLQLDFGVPVIFGLLVRTSSLGRLGEYENKLVLIFLIKTVFNDEQARVRAGLTANGHNHGEDWGEAGETFRLNLFSEN